MEQMNDVLGEVNGSLKLLNERYPEQMKAFGSFMRSAEKEGTLSHKSKELISIALSVAKHCRWCIAFHVKNALDAGATEEEIMETCFVAALMGGGPSLMYTQLVVKALDDFKGSG
ncbi:MAG: carboxymuconolactone decarboxylase family protein [Candidatus Altiarchaeales archaeon]|nr:carboxymuconolactone decarboxylase family protein [Candidatus Altiarchaeales archaeon]MBD3417319.1 carboxymuconolactone decarboxylase family protein [Candidatus Altiarchaeales archaeon]